MCGWKDGWSLVVQRRWVVVVGGAVDCVNFEHSSLACGGLSQCETSGLATTRTYVCHNTYLGRQTPSRVFWYRCSALSVWMFSILMIYNSHFAHTLHATSTTLYRGIRPSKTYAKN